MNFFDEQGQQYPFLHIEQLANEDNISLRTGCFCNPGIDELIHCLSADKLKSYFTSRHHGDYDDMKHFLGSMRGAVRISIGIATTKADIDRFIQFAKKLMNQRQAITESSRVGTIPALTPTEAVL